MSANCLYVRFIKSRFIICARNFRNVLYDHDRTAMRRGKLSSTNFHLNVLNILSFQCTWHRLLSAHLLLAAASTSKARVYLTEFVQALIKYTHYDNTHGLIEPNAQNQNGILKCNWLVVMWCNCWARLGLYCSFIRAFFSSYVQLVSDLVIKLNKSFTVLSGILSHLRDRDYVLVLSI